MSNHEISHSKTLFDIFNMINPNCYQAFIIQCVIENKKEEALQYCDELSTAFEYYKWDSTSKQSNYVDALICESNLAKWQKLAIIQIISNNVTQCRSTIKNAIDNEIAETEKRRLSINRTNDLHHQQLNDLYKMFGFDGLFR